MEDEKIIELYWARSESAVSETENKYGRYLKTVARNILSDEEDSLECVNDTYLNAWNAIPPSRPRVLQSFLGRITRNLALDRYRANTAEKRGGGQLALALDELLDVSSGENVADTVADRSAITDALKLFLSGLTDEDRRIFLKRYWYFMSVKDVAHDMSLGESSVKMRLLRMRESLRRTLIKEGIEI
ncbi:MAG: sigma-70 family RNA polymerase sigma factor [Firmicutes bacterium]|nr:sigma-70 family RNA polymerase sigma factor [Bacillota bacterium]MBR6236278.1 sigma-70 family RNA polymerase sigma factor [Bacillota bacterium]